MKKYYDKQLKKAYSLHAVIKRQNAPKRSATVTCDSKRTHEDGSKQRVDFHVQLRQGDIRELLDQTEDISSDIYQTKFPTKKFMRPSCTCNTLPVRGKVCPHVVFTCEKLDVPLATQLPVEDSRARWLEQIRVAGQVYEQTSNC